VDALRCVTAITHTWVDGLRHSRDESDRWVDRPKGHELTALIFFARLEDNGARGRNRTTDTRIFNPKLWIEDQAVTGEISVKPTTENQALSSRLSNHLRARKGALVGWCRGVFESVKRYDPSPLMRRRFPFPGARA